MTILNIADWVECTEVEGPGRRLALWVQGCALRCPGCCNPHMFALAPRTILESGLFVAKVIAAKRRFGIEGVTFLGGEPMLQAQGLADIARAARAERLSVMVFSGYYREELDAMALLGVADLLAETDLLVDGPFVKDQPERRRNWAGSTNQRFHFLTTRYRPGIEYDEDFPQGFEVRVTAGRVHINGWPEQYPHRAGKL